MNEVAPTTQRQVPGPGPWRPRPEPVWLLNQQRDEAATPADPPTATIETLSERVRANALTVSVVMPTWNRSQVIGVAIDSALAQHHPIHELLIVDDGSDDDTVDLIRANYGPELEHGRIRLIETDHGGVSSARNLGLASAVGDIVAYLDSDNSWDPWYTAMAVSVYDDDPSVASTYCGWRCAGGDSDAELRGRPYDRAALISSNYIDLNVFTHRRRVYDQLGGFDTDLKRLVDWDLILRYSRLYPPVYIPYVGATYVIAVGLGNITNTVELEPNRARVEAKTRDEQRYLGPGNLRLAYVLWDYPAASQTFVHREIRELHRRGIDVNVYWHVEPDRALDNWVNEVPTYRVRDAEELASFLTLHERTMCHSHFAHPAASMLTHPACIIADVPYTFMPHAVDIFLDLNRERNNVVEVANHHLCSNIFVYGRHHEDFLVGLGVDRAKIAHVFQAVDIDPTSTVDSGSWASTGRGLFLGRFIEKKGAAVLIEAAAALRDTDLKITLAGYGPLAPELRTRIDELGLASVQFAPPPNGESELRALYDCHDFLVVPSVIAANGDMDGFPTVIFEAMALGMPVVCSDVSSIPDHLHDGVHAHITKAGSVPSLAAGLRKALTLDSAERKSLILSARSFLEQHVGTDLTVDRLLDSWQAVPIDIVLVTYNAPGYESFDEVVELVDRLDRLTTTPFHLIIVDNSAKDPDFVTRLRSLVNERSNTTLLSLPENVFCGPASNIAFRTGHSEIALYLCSRESFPLRRGWEQPFIRHFRSNPKSQIAGHMAVTPGFVTGAEYQRREEFWAYRERSFAMREPRRTHAHVQGGLYGIRRSFVRDHGGFNDLIPHNGMDIELSYYIEALGLGVGQIPEVVSTTAKTRPTFLAHIDHRTVAVHPPLLAELEDLDNFDACSVRCNACGWWAPQSHLMTRDDFAKFGCPGCGSSGLGRLMHRWLAGDKRAHRGFPLTAFSFDRHLGPAIGQRAFELDLRMPTWRDTEAIAHSEAARIAIVDREGLELSKAVAICERLRDALPPGSSLIGPSEALDEPTTVIGHVDATLQFPRRRYAQIDIQ